VAGAMANEAATTTDAYFQTRFAFDPKREVVWREIIRYFHTRHIVPRGSTVLELGAGYCHFINNVDAKQKIALDTSAVCRQHASADIRVLTQRCDEPLPLDAKTVDVVFASNLFEHLARPELECATREILRILRPGGRLVVVQPNYKFCAKHYFDDYTHVSVFSHVSLTDFFQTHGFTPVIVQPRFLPFSMKSRLPAVSWGVRLYLNLPLRPFAAQMLLVLEKR
jgi:SAM-dependent methyltransferase